MSAPITSSSTTRTLADDARPADRRGPASEALRGDFQTALRRQHGTGTAVTRAPTVASPESAQALQTEAYCKEASRRPPLRTDDETRSSESQAYLYTQQVAATAAGLTQAAQPVSTAAFAELIERHVRHLAASASTDARDQQVLLRMSDATLPGTDLLLRRTGEGWVLEAHARSRTSFDAISTAAPLLAERFAARDFGRLSVEPQLMD